jgi:ActR/RegA family two-component response regulator
MDKKSKPGVLIVDEEENIRFVVAKLLHGEGYDVHMASGLRTAGKMVSEIDFSVAIIDPVLGNGESGMDLLDQIHRIQPMCQTILITAYPSFESAARAMTRQAFAYLLKPLRKNDILGAVARAARHHKEQRNCEMNAYYFDMLFESSIHAVAIYTSAGRIIRANPAFTDLFGYQRWEVAGRRLPRLHRAEGGRMEPDPWSINGKTDIETRCLTREAREIDVVVRCIPCTDQFSGEASVMAIYSAAAKTEKKPATSPAIPDPVGRRRPAIAEIDCRSGVGDPPGDRCFQSPPSPIARPGAR